MISDHLQYRVEVLKHRPVLEPQHANVQLSQEFRPRPIILRGDRIEVSLAVQLYREPGLGAVEIQDVIAYAVLPSELLAIQLRALEVLPKNGLGGGEGIS